MQPQKVLTELQTRLANKIAFKIKQIIKKQLDYAFLELKEYKDSNYKVKIVSRSSSGKRSSLSPRERFRFLSPENISPIDTPYLDLSADYNNPESSLALEARLHSEELLQNSSACLFKSSLRQDAYGSVDDRKMNRNLLMKHSLYTFCLLIRYVKQRKVSYGFIHIRSAANITRTVNLKHSLPKVVRRTFSARLVFALI